MRGLRRGSQAIEFAIVLPLLMALTSGTIDIGAYLARTAGLVDAASDGARAGAADEDDPQGTAVATAQAAWDSMGFFGDPVFTASVEGEAPTERVVVSASLAFAPYFGFVPVPEVLDYRCAFRLDTQAE